MGRFHTAVLRTDVDRFFALQLKPSSSGLRALHILLLDGDVGDASLKHKTLFVSYQLLILLLKNVNFR